MLIGVALFLLLVVALLAIPVSLTFDLNSDRASDNRVELVWMFGLVRARIPLDQADPQLSEVDKAEDKAERSKGRGKSALKLILHKSFRQRILHYVSDVWNAIEKDNIKIRIKAGLDDPADTGRLWAVVGPLAGALSALRQLSIDIEPDFVQADLQLNSSGSARFSPLKVILISFGLLLSPAFWQGIRQTHAT